MAIALRRHGNETGQINVAPGMLICLTGIDGSGKSTQAEKLVARLRTAGYPAHYVWAGRKSSFTAPFVQLGKSRMHAPKRPSTVSVEVNASYRSYMRNMKHLFKRPLVREAWQWLTLTEHILQIWKRVTVPLARGEIVVCDRYLYDTLVSQAVLFGVVPDQFMAEWHDLVLRLVPRPTVGFWLDVPSDIALSRKADIYDREHLEARQPLYAYLAQRLALRTLDATLEADILANTIWYQVHGLLWARASDVVLPH